MGTSEQQQQIWRIDLQAASVKLKAFPTQLTRIRFTMKLMLRIPEKSVDW